MKWEIATESKPVQGERVLIKIRYEDNPVVGYWGCGEWEACCVNHKTNCSTYCYGGSPDGNFGSDEVTHYALITGLDELL